MEQGQLINDPIRGRLNAWLLAVVDASMHRLYGGIKSRLLAETPPVVVELGPGSGANLRYLPRGTRLIAIEPNSHTHPMLRRRARQYGIDLDLRRRTAEKLDLDSASVDFVFSSLVLCSVGQPEQVVAEVRRVLKPGGRFACIEHVRAPAGCGSHRVQQLIRRPWKWIFQGCDLCRDTGAMLCSSGFSRVELQPILLSSIFAPVRHQIVAVCVN